MLGNCWHSMKLVTKCSTAGLRARNQGCRMPSGQIPRLPDAFSNDRQCLATHIPVLHLQYPHKSLVCDSIDRMASTICRPFAGPFNTLCLVLTRTVYKGHYLHLPAEEMKAHRGKRASLSTYCDRKDSFCRSLIPSFLDASFLWVSEVA